MGATLARSLLGAGRDVSVGVRRPEAYGALAGELGVPVERAADAVADAVLVLLALPGGGAVADFAAEHAAGLAGKVLVDATNDLSGGSHGDQLSSVPALEAAVPGAAVYRAFNSMGWENMAAPRFSSLVADLPYAGPDGERRPEVEALIADVGFRPAYVGAGADAHAAVDALATLWFCLAFGQGRGRRLALRLLDAKDDGADDTDGQPR